MRIALSALIFVTFCLPRAHAEETIEGAVGYLALLGGGRCTGTLISPTIVLTAAHCLKGMVGSQVRFTLNPNPDNEPKASFAPGETLRMHPDFRYGFQNGISEHDVALVKLADTNYGAPPPTLPKLYGGDELPAGTTARAVGYGFDKDGKVGQRRTRQVRLTGWATGADGKVGKTVLRMTRGDLGHLPCAGDSGGPVFKFLDGRNQIVAVHSAGSVQNKLIAKTLGSSPDKANQFLCRETDFSDAISLAAERAWLTRTFAELQGKSRDLSSISAECEAMKDGAPCSVVGQTKECGSGGEATTWSCCGAGLCFCGCADEEEALLPLRSPVRAFHRLLGGDLWWWRGTFSSAARCAAENGAPCEGVAKAQAKVGHDTKTWRCTVEVKSAAAKRNGNLVHCAFTPLSEFLKSYGTARSADPTAPPGLWTSGRCGT